MMAKLESWVGTRSKIHAFLSPESTLHSLVIFYEPKHAGMPTRFLRFRHTFRVEAETKQKPWLGPHERLWRRPTGGRARACTRLNRLLVFIDASNNAYTAVDRPLLPLAV